MGCVASRLRVSPLGLIDGIAPINQSVILSVDVDVDVDVDVNVDVDVDVNDKDQ